MLYFFGDSFMKLDYTVHCSWLLVVLVHVGVLAITLMTPLQQYPVATVLPSIQGLIVSAKQPSQPPMPPIPMPPAAKPIPVFKSQNRLPKSPASERATAVEATEVQAPQEFIQPSSVPPSPESLVLPHTDASHINNLAPEYPSVSRRLAEEGVVLLEILVRADGTVGELRLKNSSGYTRLDEAALRAVKHWHFVPAVRGEQKIDYWYELPIEFLLNK